jgi:hypothetical protein
MSDAFDLASGVRHHEFEPGSGAGLSRFKDCQTLSPTAQLGEITEAGGISFTARPGDYQRMTRCLDEKHGYKFQ